MGRRRLISAFAGAFSMAMMAGACGNDGSADDQPLPAVLVELLATPSAGGERSIGDDHFEVWICHVPLDSTAAMYGGLPLRLALTPQGVTDVVNRRVPEYFESLSHGQYRPAFTPGGEVTIAADDLPQACVDGAIAGAGDDTEAVLVVADAEHAADQPGGFGSGGEPCPPTGQCSVATTRRVAYVGASDFHPDWGDDPPMDLVEHEIGHSLGWVHSAINDAGDYLSGLDVMSNSAAPREAEPTRRDGPGTLAINLFLAGWLPSADIVVARDEASVELAASNGEKGTRLLILDNSGGSLYTVELLTASGLDDHLPTGGIAVHEVHIVDGVLEPMAAMVGSPPHVALLQPDVELQFGEWTLTAAPDWTVTARKAASP